MTQTLKQLQAEQKKIELRTNYPHLATWLDHIDKCEKCRLVVRASKFSGGLMTKHDVLVRCCGAGADLFAACMKEVNIDMEMT